MLDDLYQEALEKSGARYDLWEKIRAGIALILWPSWKELCNFLLGNRETLTIEAG